VLRAIYASIHLIAEQPLSYRQTDNPGIRVHALQRYRYRIFCSIAGDAVEIIHGRHSARRSWAGR
jgi:hypothetical protein